MEEATTTAKRSPESSCGGELGHQPRRKKARDLKEVAELTLALAAMVEMRGGRGPTVKEREMMEEVRGKLVEVCGGFSPRDIFPVNDFGVVMEELGLDKVRDQRGLGFRPTAKLSIAEKMVYTKQKFEKAEANALRSATQAESRVAAAAPTANIFPSEKPKPVPVSSGPFPSLMPKAHPSATISTSLPYQLPAGELRKPAVSGGLPDNLLGKDSSRVERPPYQRPNGASFIPQMQANLPGSHVQPAWAQRIQAASLAKPGVYNKPSPQNPVKYQGNIKFDDTTLTAASRMASHPAGPKPNQSTPIQQMQKTNVVQNSIPNNTHGDISKVVLKFLQLHLPKRAAWNPPSRDYMNKPITCQVCKQAVVEVENILVCDACENGYHKKCLQIQDLKTIPRGEWHCFKCLALTDGKPLPPKYGRVTRNVTAPKAAMPSFPEKKSGISNDQANQQKLMANGSGGTKNSPASSMLNTNNSASNSNASNARAMQGNDISLSIHNTNDKNENVVLKVATAPSSVSVENSHEEKLGPEIKRDTPPKLCSNGKDNEIIVSRCSEGITSKKNNDNHLAVENPETFNVSKSRDGVPSVDGKQEEKGVAHVEIVENSDNIVDNNVGSSSDGLIIVDWIGDVAHIADEKTYYSSCCINGNVYNVQDHAFFLCNKKLMPSRIQDMWEDNKTRLKWVLVNRCYFPGDLPDAVGHPCSLEGNEVYESNHGCTLLASLIQGPCEVLHPEKFIQEKERRSRLASEEIHGLRPFFQCKWFYDESKGSFRDISSLSQPDMV